MAALEEKATNRCGSRREDEDCAGSDARSLGNGTHEGMITVNMALMRLIKRETYNKPINSNSDHYATILLNPSQISYNC
jgi:hypothetical protein